MRELLVMPGEDAREVVLQCLLTADPKNRMSDHVCAYIELVLALDVPLDRFLAHIESLPEVDEEHEFDEQFCFRMLALCAKHRVGPSERFLWRYLVNGAQRKLALNEALFLVELPADVWVELLPSISDENLRGWVEDGDYWRTLARSVPRIAKALTWRRQSDQAWKWSLSSYEQAEYSSRRFQLLKRAFADDPQLVQEQLVEGLWDGGTYYREFCIMRVDLGRPGVRERLVELGSCGTFGLLATQRLEKESE